MPTPPLFRFYLKADATHWYYLNGTSISLSDTERPIVNTPDKWEETELSWARNNKYWGAMRKLSTPYAFVKDGAAILRWIYYTQGIEGKCQLVIKKNRSVDWLYEDYYSGELDFSQTTDSFLQTVVNIMESGLVAIVKGYENTLYEIPIDDTDCVVTYMDGILLRGKYNWLALSSDALDGDSGTGSQFVPDRRSIGIYSGSSIVEGDYPIAVSQTQTNISMQGDYTTQQLASLEAFNNYEFLAQQDMDVVVSFKQQYTVKYTLIGAVDTAKLSVYIRIVDESNGDFVYSERIYSDPAGTAYNQTRTLDIDVTSSQFQMKAGQRLYLVFNISTGNSIVTFSEGSVILASTFRLAPSKVKGYRFITLLQKLISKMTDGQFTASSSYLSSAARDWDCAPYNVIVTCGDALRGLTTDSTGNFSQPKIKTSLAQLFKTANTVFGLGLGIESNKVVLEKLAYFFDPANEIANLGEISFPELSPMTFGNSIKVGYPDQTYDTLNGKDEYNTTVSLKLPILRTPAEIDMLSEYRADMYGMEILRANLSQKKTTDSSSDNDTFIYEIGTQRSDGSYELYRPQNTAPNTATGVLFPSTAINLTLTPGRNLRRNGKYIAVITHLLANGALVQPITFQTIFKNASLKSSLGSGKITESANIPLDSLPAPLFLPIYIKFQISRGDLAQLMNSSTKGYFSFTIKGHVFKGFVDDVGMRPAKLDTYLFSLLLHPDTDLQLLSNILSA